MDSKLMVMNYAMNRLFQSVDEEMAETRHINRQEMGSFSAKPALICWKLWNLFYSIQLRHNGMCFQ